MAEDGFHAGEEGVERDYFYERLIWVLGSLIFSSRRFYWLIRPVGGPRVFRRPVFKGL